MSDFDELAMRARINNCLKTVAVVLDASKSNSLVAADIVVHRYEDKYLLANQLTNTSIRTLLNALGLIGMSTSVLSTLQEWNDKREVSLKFERKQRSTFLRETERDVEDPTRIEVVDGVQQTTVKMITKVKEYIYLVEEEYTLSAHSGVGDNAAEVVQITKSSGQLEATVRNNSSPFSEFTVDAFDVNISWLLKHVDIATSTGTGSFSIDRAHLNCFTPRQNPAVADALQFFASFSSFCEEVQRKMERLQQLQNRFSDRAGAKFDISAAYVNQVFNPIVPLFEDIQKATGLTAHVHSEDEATVATDSALVAGPALSGQVVEKLTVEQRRTLESTCNNLADLFPSGHNAVFGVEQAQLMLVVAHVSKIAHFHRQGVDFIEHMIRQQLVAAVGKELTARDFAQYMTFHNRKVFKEAYQPKPFSYAVRRSPLHSPEGQIQIETAEVTPAEPIYTVAQHTENAPHMEFALNATTTVKFGGERHLHGWMAHRFSGQALPELKLVAEARQFSSYIVLIGRIASAKLFQPKYGFIVQNKDEFRIPLELEQIPTAKEFKDAISSLSPEQQRFAKAFRSMQLESTLFGVCVIQIKPQLEKVLKLQADSLTKEIKLTQDLMQLFIKYQIPSDLLSFDDSVPGGASVPASERLVKVKRHVQAMQEMLATAKDEEVADQQEKRAFHGSRGGLGEGSMQMSYFSSLKPLATNQGLVAFGAPAPTAVSNFGADQAGSGGFGAPHSATAFGAVQPSSGGFRGPGFGAPAAAPSASFGASQPANPFGACAPAVSTGFGASMPATGAFGAPSSAPSTVPTGFGGHGAAPSTNSNGFGAVQPFSFAATPSVTASAGGFGAPPAGTHPTLSTNISATASPPQSVSSAAHNNDQYVPEHAAQGEQVDYTQYPNKLEEMYTRYDPESSLRPTIINPGATWTKRSQAGLLSAPQTTRLSAHQQAAEKSAAFDLLDALTRSGALPIEHASLHVIIAATHCFDQSLMDTVVQKNVNPIERVERSTLIMAAALNDVSAAELITEGQVERMNKYSPMLFGHEERVALE